MAKYNNLDLMICIDPSYWRNGIISFVQDRKYEICGRRLRDFNEFMLIGEDGTGYWFTERTLELHFKKFEPVDNFEYAMGIV